MYVMRDHDENSRVGYVRVGLRYEYSTIVVLALFFVKLQTSTLPVLVQTVG